MPGKGKLPTSSQIVHQSHSQGIYVGYRGYDRRGTEPLFPSGFGLSYTSFAWERISLNRYMLGRGEEVSVTLTLRNTGTCAGAEVVQIYGRPGKTELPRPLRELKGFAKVMLQPGEVRDVTISLSSRDFSYWHPGFKDCVADDGECQIEAGSSSRAIRLEQAIRVASSIERHGFITFETQPKHILAYPRARRLPRLPLGPDGDHR